MSLSVSQVVMSLGVAVQFICVLTVNQGHECDCYQHQHSNGEKIEKERNDQPSLVGWKPSLVGWRPSLWREEKREKTGETRREGKEQKGGT